MSNFIQNCINVIGDRYGMSGYSKTTAMLKETIPDLALTRDAYDANRKEILQMTNSYDRNLRINNYYMSMSEEFVSSIDDMKAAKQAETQVLTTNVKMRLAAMVN